MAECVPSIWVHLVAPLTLLYIQIWNNLVLQKLEDYMGDMTLAKSAYTDPLSFILVHAAGTPERAAIARAHDETQVRLSLNNPALWD